MDAALPLLVRTRVVVCFATAYPTLLMMMMLELELAAWRKLNTGSVKHKFLRPCGVFCSFVLIGLVVNFKRKANFGLGMIFIFIFTFVLVSLPVWRPVVVGVGVSAVWFIGGYSLTFRASQRRVRGHH